MFGSDLIELFNVVEVDLASDITVLTTNVRGCQMSPTYPNWKDCNVLFNYYVSYFWIQT